MLGQDEGGSKKSSHTQPRVYSPVSTGMGTAISLSEEQCFRTLALLKSMVTLGDMIGQLLELLPYRMNNLS